MSEVRSGRIQVVELVTGSGEFRVASRRDDEGWYSVNANTGRCNCRYCQNAPAVKKECEPRRAVREYLELRAEMQARAPVSTARAAGLPEEKIWELLKPHVERQTASA